MIIPTCPACTHPLTPDDEHACTRCRGQGSVSSMCYMRNAPTAADCKGCFLPHCDCPDCDARGSWFECPACGWRSTDVGALVWRGGEGKGA